MGYPLLFAELVIVSFLSVLTAFLIVVLWSRKSPLKICHKSPALLFVLSTTILISVLTLIHSVLFMINASGWRALTDIEIKMTVVLGLGLGSCRVLYDLATWTLFMQRILIVGFPLRNLRRLNLMLILLSILVSLSLFGYYFVRYLPDGLADSTPVPSDCYLLACMSQYRKAKTFADVVKIVFNIVIVVTGTLLVVLFKVKKIAKFSSSSEWKVHALTRYFFYLRIVLEMGPRAADLALVNTTGISIANYIGSYGLVGTAVDAFVCTWLVCRVFLFKAVQTVQTLNVVNAATGSNHTQ